MGAYSRWAPIRGWALIRINTVGLEYLSDFGPYYDDIVAHLGGDKV